ncbi:major tail protein [Clostridium merdae]|uniref:major tail protein n=1 Tax=Clostridium merdae TaxID=1958780 RepID=UPI000A267D7A|nr:major tail protein [Clostridium merdae]
MDKKYAEFVGVDNLHYAKITEDSEANYTTEVPKYLAPTAEISSEVEIENTPTYYDNVAAFNYVSEGTTTLTVTVSGVPANTAAELLGKDYDEANGMVLDDGVPTPPEIALSFRFNKGAEDYRYYQYMKGTFSGGAEEAASKSGSVDIKTYELTYTAVVTTHKFAVGGKQKGLKRIFADTDDVNFKVATATGWFAKVQTPITTPEG